MSCIRCTIGTSSLGSVLVGATDNGICAIALDDNPNVLKTYVQTLFPSAQWMTDSQELADFLSTIVTQIEHPMTRWNVPLDICGTTFQKQVWEALQRIPSGTTASYTDIALQIGRPKAVRAVAQACAQNRIAVAIPCHRVVRADGSLSGYRWGKARKAALLERERNQGR